MRVQNIKAIRIKLASPDEILSWSSGEVTKPETINYRTQRAERDGLFCQKIFGPEKDYQCYCGKYRGVKYKGLTCDRCGVEITKSSVRRERMGHIRLVSPVAHIWFLRGVPSAMGMVLNKTREELERVIYFMSYIITEVDEEEKKRLLGKIEKDYEERLKKQLANVEDKKKAEEIKSSMNEEKEKAKREIMEIQPLRVISELEYRSLFTKYKNLFKAGTGAETLRKIFEKIDLDKEVKKIENELKKSGGQRRDLLLRLRFFKRMKMVGVRPEWMFLTILPVLPPELRPMVQLDGGRFASSDLNDLYRRVINRNNRLKYLLEIKAPDVIIRNEKRMLQEAVDALIDNTMRKSVTTKATTGGRRLLKSLADLLKGKQGRFRQNLLGKRVDYSGRSVIVVGPQLKITQVGVPKQMALEIFRPFVIRKLLEKGHATNVKIAQDLIEDQAEPVWDVLEEVVKDKLVLVNRAPTLHRLNIQAFKPILTEGKAIQLHPMVCKAYNADFDGDQMAIFLPISQKAQEEARERMFSLFNLLKPATGKPIVTLYQDIVLGCYYLTQLKENAMGEGKIFSDFEEVLLAYELGNIDLRAKIKVRRGNEIIETSAGRIIFNSVLPPDFPFQNREIKIKDLENLIFEIYQRYPTDKLEEILDNIKELGFEYATISGTTFGIDELISVPDKEKILKEAEMKTEDVINKYEDGLLSKREKSLKIIEIWSNMKSKIEKIVPTIFPQENSISRMILAGARGSWSQVVQMVGMKGLVVNPMGKIIELPVKNSYADGFSEIEYFISTHGARKGMVDKALRTSTAGYLTRRLIDVAHEVIVNEPDCKDQKGITIYLNDAKEIGQDPLMKIVGRIVVEDVKTKSRKILVKKGEMIDWKKGKEIVEAGVEKIQVRSPLSCKNRRRAVCQKCYGLDLGRNKLVDCGEAVGIIAAQSIGEPGTQLTMRTFHYGGVLGEADITVGLPRVDEILENRAPNIEAIVSEVSGTVIDISDHRKIRIRVENGNSEVEYQVPPQFDIFVRKGDKVKKGQQLTEGNLNFRRLFDILEKEELWRKMINEVQKIYVSQGVQIHDKHIEIIIKQMFSRVRIIDPGDSTFLPGEIVEKGSYLMERDRLKKEGKTPPKAKQLLLGISKVALTTPSFLSAASFQETTRVLIKASLDGIEDPLLGLKENVIIGKIIPAGTGFQYEKEK